MFYCKAQQPGSKFSAQILFGVSLPVGKFANKSLTSDSISNASGLAKSGPALQIAFHYYVTKHFGLSLLVGAQENKQDPNSITNNMKQYYPDSFYFRAVTNYWKIGKILAGGNFKIPISTGSKFYFEPGLAAGIAKTSIPGFTFTATKAGGLSNGFTIGGSEPEISLRWTFCYTLDAGFGWHLSKSIFISANINYFSSTPSRSYTIYPTNPPAGNGTHYETNYPITSMAFFAGIGYWF